MSGATTIIKYECEGGGECEAEGRAVLWVCSRLGVGSLKAELIRLPRVAYIVVNCFVLIKVKLQNVPII